MNHPFKTYRLLTCLTVGLHLGDCTERSHTGHVETKTSTDTKHALQAFPRRTDAIHPVEAGPLRAYVTTTLPRPLFRHPTRALLIIFTHLPYTPYLISFFIVFVMCDVAITFTCSFRNEYFGVMSFLSQVTSLLTPSVPWPGCRSSLLTLSAKTCGNKPQWTSQALTYVLYASEECAPRL